MKYITGLLILVGCGSTTAYNSYTTNNPAVTQQVSTPTGSCQEVVFYSSYNQGNNYFLDQSSFVVVPSKIKGTTGSQVMLYFNNMSCTYSNNSLTSCTQPLDAAPQYVQTALSSTTAQGVYVNLDYVSNTISVRNTTYNSTNTLSLYVCSN